MSGRWRSGPHCLKGEAQPLLCGGHNLIGEAKILLLGTPGLNGKTSPSPRELLVSWGRNICPPPSFLQLCFVQFLLVFFLIFLFSLSLLLLLHLLPFHLPSLIFAC